MTFSNSSTKRWLIEHVNDVKAWDLVHSRNLQSFPKEVKQTFAKTHYHNMKRIHYYADGLYTAPSSIPEISKTERGLYCIFDVKQNTLIDWYMGQVRNQQQQNEFLARKRYPNRYLRYTWEYNDTNGDTYFIDPTDKFAKVDHKKFVLPFINEPPPDTEINVCALHYISSDKTNQIVFITAKDIPAHTEFLISYGTTHERDYPVGKLDIENLSFDTPPKQLLE
jgi:hypothetical protein